MSCNTANRSAHSTATHRSPLPSSRFKVQQRFMNRTHTIDGITLHLGSPDATSGEWIGQRRSA
ncbi:MAG UNVERIFIED_CONTAM: hypothetical protein LVR18_13700 [Planctomycetaceae bacterium]